MDAQRTSRNQEILDQVEGLGGAYVWDAEIFTVAFMNGTIADDTALLLTQLTGVQQIALTPSGLTFPVLHAIASVPGLESLVLFNSALDENQLKCLRLVVSEVIEAHQ
ncbi:hypothetical protein [Polaromonas sp. YR568]|uniref:hypothetical protein n=1 Tax=Polaromonas sp. YR568 TaxID=1855301 RepID=UPI00398C0B20